MRTSLIGRPARLARSAAGLRLTTVALAAGTALLLAGCAGGNPAAQGPSIVATAPATATPTPTATTPPTPTATPTPTEEPGKISSSSDIKESTKAGTVKDGKTADASGSGPKRIKYSTKGKIAVVVTLDCSKCTGLVNVTAPGRMSPLGEQKAPFTASYLVDVMEDDDAKQEILLTADGKWKVTLMSWNNLPLVSGKQSGTGSAVMYFSDDVKKIKVTYKPKGDDDSFIGRVFTESGKPQAFGDSVAFSENFKADLPGVVAISTNGKWSVTPR